jgi:hypothetical protein
LSTGTAVSRAFTQVTDTGGGCGKQQSFSTSKPGKVLPSSRLARAWQVSSVLQCIFSGGSANQLFWFSYWSRSKTRDPSRCHAISRRHIPTVTPCGIPRDPIIPPGPSRDTASPLTPSPPPFLFKISLELGSNLSPFLPNDLMVHARVGELGELGDGLLAAEAVTAAHTHRVSCRAYPFGSDTSMGATSYKLSAPCHRMLLPFHP